MEALPAQPDRQRLDEAGLVLDDQHGRMWSSELLLRRGRGRLDRAGQRDAQDERRALALLRRHEHVAAVVGGDVADDRQAEPGAAGVAAAGPVDAVEALEDAVEVARPGCRCRGRRPSARPTRPSTRTRTCTLLPGSLYLTAFSTRLPSADTSWRRSPRTIDAVGAGRATWTAMPRCSAHVRDALHGAVDDVADVDGVAHRLLAELDPGQLEQVVDRARDPVRLAHHPLGDALDDLEVVLVGERLGQHGERPDRRLQLVADVGHEVGAHGVDAGGAR